MNYDERFIFSDLTVKDKKTRLVWARDANIAGRRLNWYEANDYIWQLNMQLYAGYNDWRLPTKNELASLVDYTRNERKEYGLHELFNKNGYKNVQADYYWSATTIYTNDTTFAWGVNMCYGYVSTINWTLTNYLWPVRGRK
jgi:hypothetical protein